MFSPTQNMKIRFLMLTAFVLLLAATSSFGQKTVKKIVKTAAPEQIVKDLYAQHDKPGYPFFQNKNRSLVDKYFTKELANLIWADAVDARDGVGKIGFDPIYVSQDGKITALKIIRDQVEGDQAIVLASFKNEGKDVNVIFVAERVNKIWKISNITADDYNLIDTLSSEASDETERGDNPEMQGADRGGKPGQETETGEFEGDYTIGATTCTVKPIKMAFEVKCAGERAAKIFFFDGNANDQPMFTSEAHGSFVFTDESLSKGVFIDNKGNKVNVKRALPKKGKSGTSAG